MVTILTLRASAIALPLLGLHLLLGEHTGEMRRNQVRTLDQGRISVYRAVFERSWIPFIGNCSQQNRSSGSPPCYKLRTRSR